jgi:hypothetical protein
MGPPPIDHIPSFQQVHMMVRGVADNYHRKSSKNSPP